MATVLGLVAASGSGPALAVDPPDAVATRADASPLAASLLRGVPPDAIPFRYTCSSGPFRVMRLFDGPAGSDLTPPIDEDGTTVLWRAGSLAVTGRVRSEGREGEAISYTRWARSGDGWEQTGRGGCRPRAVFPDLVASGGYWLPAGRGFQSADRRLDLRVWDSRACRSAVDVRGRARVVETDAAVLIAVPTARLENTDICRHGPPARVRVRLKEPIGTRSVYDAGTLPLRRVGRPAVTRRQDGVVLTVRLQGGDRLVAGRPATLRTTLRNLRDEPIFVQGSPACGSVTHVTGWMTDARWPAFDVVEQPPMTADGSSEPPVDHLRWWIQQDLTDTWPHIWLGFSEPGTRGCGDVGRETRVPPGGVIRERLVWDGQADDALGPPPDGPVRLDGSSSYRLKGADGFEQLRVRLKTEIVGGRSASWPGPMQIVETALADLEAAGLLTGVGLGHATDGYAAFDVERGVWVVGTCGEWDEVAVRWRVATVDPATDTRLELYDHRGGDDCVDFPFDEATPALSDVP